MNEVIELGKHRLLCGDATEKSNVDMLIGEDEVNLLLTDPPYGIDIVKANTSEGGAVGHQGGPAVTPFKDKRNNRRGKTSNIQEKREREREREQMSEKLEDREVLQSDHSGTVGIPARPGFNTHTHQMMGL